MKLDCFIFDFDGTLAYSEPAYREAFRHSIRLHTGLEVTEVEFRDYWNTTPQEVLRRYSEELLEEMLVSFEEHYYANHHYLIPTKDSESSTACTSTALERQSSLKPDGQESAA